MLYHRFRTLPFIRSILKKELGNLETILQDKQIKPALIVDLGTGNGTHLSVFTKQIPVVGVDRSLKMLQQAGKRHPEILCVVADTNRLPFHGRFCDFALAVGLLEYMRDKETWLAEAERILCSGGYLLMTFSPPGMFTSFRNLLGHAVYPLSLEDFRKMIAKQGLALVQWKQSWLQIQCLLHKN